MRQMSDVQQLVDSNVVFTSVKSRVNDVVGGVPVQRTIKCNSFVAIKNIVMSEEIIFNKDHLVPGGTRPQKTSSWCRSAWFYTHMVPLLPHFRYYYIDPYGYHAEQQYNKRYIYLKKIQRTLLVY